jgi:hypothetical protein
MYLRCSVAAPIPLDPRAAAPGSEAHATIQVIVTEIRGTGCPTKTFCCFSANFRAGFQSKVSSKRAFHPNQNENQKNNKMTGKRRAGSRQTSHEPHDAPNLPKRTEHPFYYLRSGSKESLKRLLAPKLSGTVDLIALHGLQSKLDEVVDRHGKGTKAMDPTIKAYANNLLTFNLDPWLKPDAQPAPPKPPSLMQIAYSDFSTAGEIKPLDKHVMDTSLRLRKGDNKPVEDAFPLVWLGGKDIITVPVTRPKIVIKSSKPGGQMTSSPRTAMESAILSNPALGRQQEHVSPMAGKRRLSTDEYPDSKRYKHS